MSAAQLALIAMALGVFVIANDFTALSVAIPNIEHDLGTSLTTAQWVINGYALSKVPVGALSSLGAQVGIHRVQHSRLAKKQDALSSVAVQANAVDAERGVNQQLYGYTGTGVTVAAIDAGFTSAEMEDLADPRARKFVDCVSPNNRTRTGRR